MKTDRLLPNAALEFANSFLPEVGSRATDTKARECDDGWV